MHGLASAATDTYRTLLLRLETISTEPPPALVALDEGVCNVMQLPYDTGRAHPGAINEATITKNGSASHQRHDNGTFRALYPTYAHHVRMRAYENAYAVL